MIFIYLLTAIGFTTSGRRRDHIYKKQYGIHLNRESTIHIYTYTEKYTFINRVDYKFTHRQYSTHLHTDSTVHI